MAFDCEIINLKRNIFRKNPIQNSNHICSDIRYVSLWFAIYLVDIL